MGREFTLPLFCIERQEPADWVPDCGFLGAKATAEQVKKAIAEMHTAPQWAFFPEMRIGTGYGKDVQQSIDAWAMNLYPADGLIRVSYEVKVSRGDFLAELKQPQKRKHALLVSNRFYFAAPKGLIKPEELPAEAGLIEVLDNGRAHTRIHAPWRDAMPVSSKFLASVCRRVFDEEKRKVKE